MPRFQAQDLLETYILSIFSSNIMQLKVLRLNKNIYNKLIKTNKTKNGLSKF